MKQAINCGNYTPIIFIKFKKFCTNCKNYVKGEKCDNYDERPIHHD